MPGRRNIVAVKNVPRSVHPRLRGLPGGERSPAKLVSAVEFPVYQGNREISFDSRAVRRAESGGKSDKTPTLEWSRSDWNREFISTIQGNLRGEQGTCSRLDSDGEGQSDEL
jgi:hypothetical protein